jgi:hypothetical protein
LVGQRSEGESSKMNDEQGFVADFSQFAPRAEENQSIENNVPSLQQFTGVSGAFHIYKKPSLSKYSAIDRGCIITTMALLNIMAKIGYSA